MNATGAEAPRPAHARIDGRSPGSRVTARHRLPGFCPVALWYGLAAYSCGGSCGIEHPLPTLSRKRGRVGRGWFAPHSLLSLGRGTVDRRQLTVVARRLSIRVQPFSPASARRRLAASSAEITMFW